MLVPSGPAPGPAAPTGPSPVSPAHHPLPFNSIHAREQISSAYALASQILSESRPEPPWLSLFWVEHSTAHHGTAGYGISLWQIHIAEQSAAHSRARAEEGGQASRTPLAKSWETRKCDQGPCMYPITRGFPAISLSMIPSSGDRRSSLPVPSTPSQQQQGVWRGKVSLGAKSHQIPTAACNDRQTRSRLFLLRYLALRCRAAGGIHQSLLPFAAAIGPEKAGCYMRPMHI